MQKEKKLSKIQDVQLTKCLVGLRYSVLSLLIVLSFSCSQKNFIFNENSEEELIFYCIQDYIKKERPNNDKRYHLSIYDAVPVMYINRKSEYKSELTWSIGKELSDYKAVSIIPSNSKYIIPDSLKLGEVVKSIPSRFIEKEGLFFYWFDEDYPMSEEVLATLKTHDILLEYSLDNVIQFYDQEIDDTTQGVDYYFCKSDYAIHTRIKTTKAIGFYKAPDLKCN